MTNQIFYGEQKTTEWQKLRLGLFTSSTIYHLFEDSSKQTKAIELMKQLKSGAWKVTEAVLNYRPTSYDLTYICNYLVDYGFLKKKEIKFIKKELKGLLKDGHFNSGEKYMKDCILVLTACYALNKIEVHSGSANMLCKKKAQEIIWEKPSRADDIGGVDSVEWGNDGEELARNNFEFETLFDVDKGSKKISFIKNEALQTGSSPDDTIDGKIPVEYKNPYNEGIHYDHCALKNADDLLKFDKQKYYQIQHQIFCLEADHGYFVSFDRDLLNTKFKHKALKYIEIKRNESVCSQFEPRLLKAIEVRDKFIEDF